MLEHGFGFCVEEGVSVMADWGVVFDILEAGSSCDDYIDGGLPTRMLFFLRKSMFSAAWQSPSQRVLLEVLVII
jgi:hypothetical protein